MTQTTFDSQNPSNLSDKSACVSGEATKTTMNLTQIDTIRDCVLFAKQMYAEREAEYLHSKADLALGLLDQIEKDYARHTEALNRISKMLPSGPGAGNVAREALHHA